MKTNNLSFQFSVILILICFKLVEKWARNPINLPFWDSTQLVVRGCQYYIVTQNLKGDYYPKRSPNKVHDRSFSHFTVIRKQLGKFSPNTKYSL